MEVLHFIYEGQEIDFLPTNDENLMVNATQMAKLFGKQVNEFMSNQKTQSFIEECLKNGNSRFLNIKNESDLINSKQYSGTWMHRILALKFAAWLDPAFDLWVFTTIDKILLGHYREMKEATVEKIIAEQEYKRRKAELISQNPELAEIFALELKINEADKRRIKAIKSSTRQLELKFTPQSN